MRELKDYDWNTAAQVYGILSMYAFTVKHKGVENMGYSGLEAYLEAEEMLQEHGAIDSQDFQILIDAIKDCTGKQYHLDILDETDEEQEYEEQDEINQEDDTEMTIKVNCSKLTEEQSEILSGMLKAINIVAKHFEEEDE